MRFTSPSPVHPVKSDTSDDIIDGSSGDDEHNIEISATAASQGSGEIPQQLEGPNEDKTSALGSGSIDTDVESTGVNVNLSGEKDATKSSSAISDGDQSSGEMEELHTESYSSGDSDESSGDSAESSGDDAISLEEYLGELLGDSSGSDHSLEDLSQDERDQLTEEEYIPMINPRGNQRNTGSGLQTRTTEGSGSSDSDASWYWSFVNEKQILLWFISIAHALQLVQILNQKVMIYYL